MPTTQNKNDRALAALVLLVTLAAAAYNLFAAFGLINGVSTAEVAAKFPAALTPANYAFSIWSLVSVGLIGFGIYQLVPANLERFRPVRLFFILSCLFQIAWLYVWHRENLTFSLVLIAVQLVVIFLTYVSMRGCRSVAETWLMQAPFGLYLGWTTVLTLMCLGVVLTTKGIISASSNVFAIVAILATTGFAIVVRLKLGNFFFPLAIAWGLTFIAIKQGSNTPIVVACALGVVTCLITSGSFVVHLRDSSGE